MNVYELKPSEKKIGIIFYKNLCQNKNITLYGMVELLEFSEIGKNVRNPSSDMYEPSINHSLVMKKPK
jgi:hypothetical protein